MVSNNLKNTPPRHKVVGSLNPNNIDEHVEGGQIVGDTLILDTATGGTVNIPLTGIEQAIDFSNLTELQKTTLQDCMKGCQVLDAFGNELGYLL